MKRIISLISLFVISFCITFAGERNEQQMREAAQKVISQNMPNKSRARSASNDLKELVAMPKLKIFGYDDGGFAVVTNDDRFDEVIGYSSTTFAKEMPCGFKWWLNTVNEVMENAKGDTPVSTKSRSKIKKAGVAPMITTKWGQMRPYNDQCIFTGSDGKSHQMVTGCVATAMAQVMNYHKFPIRGTGSYKYTVNFPYNGFEIVLSEDFSQSLYDWDNMLDDYSSYSKSKVRDEHTVAVSKLMKDCGIAAKTGYGDNVYGSYSSLFLAANALKNYFYYDEKTRYLSRSSYSDEDWMKLIYNELDNRRPILYSGSETESSESGHAFVLHGYDDNGRVYINWGADGDHSNDGYFSIDKLNPSGYNTTFNKRQSMVIVVPGSSQPEVEKCDITISSTGDGVVTYNGNEIRNTSKTYTTIKNSTVKLVFTPDFGSQVKNVVVNGIDVTSNLIANTYTITDISTDTNITVNFETSSGNDSDINSSLSGGVNTVSTIRMGNYAKVSMSVYLKNSSSEAITITKLVAKHPTAGYVLSTITDLQQLGDLKGGELKNVTIEFNEDVTPTLEWYYTYKATSYLFTVKGTDAKYHLTIKSSGDGVTKYNGESIRNDSRTFDIKENFYDYKIYLNPDKGNKVESLIVNGLGLTNRIGSDNTYSDSFVTRDVSIEVTYAPEAIEEYNLSITSEGNGTVSFGTEKIRSGSKSFKVEKGKEVILDLTPNEGNYLKSLTVDGTDVISKVSNNKYTITNIYKDTDISAVFAESPTNDINSSISGGVNSTSKIVVGNYAEIVMSVYLKNSSSDAITITKLIAKHPTTGQELVATVDPQILGELNGGEQKNVTIKFYEDVTPMLEWYYTYKGVSYLFTVKGTDTKYHLTIKSSGDGVTKYNGESIRNDSRTFDIKENFYDYKIYLNPDKGNKVESLIVNGLGLTNRIGSDNTYSDSFVTRDVSIEVTYAPEAIEEYNLSITSEGNGTVSFGTEKIRSDSKSFKVEKGKEVVLDLTPDEVNYLKSLTVDGADVISKVSNNKYTITNIDKDTNVSAVFVESSTNDINSSLSGGVTSTAKVVAGNYVEVAMGVFLKNSSSDAITITKLIVKHPTTGQELTTITSALILGELKGGEQKNVEIKFNVDVTPTLEWHYVYKGTSYVFTVVGTDTKYQLKISSLGNGVTEYNGESIRNYSQLYDIKENFYDYKIYLKPDKGNKVKSLIVNGSDRTSKISSDNSYGETFVRQNVTIEVTYAPEAIEEFNLSIKSEGNGAVSYGTDKIRSESKSFKVEKGKEVVVGLSPDEGNHLKSVTVDGIDVTYSVSNNRYTITNVSKDVRVEVVFEKNPSTDIRKGDVNSDGEVDVADVVATVNYILGRSSAGFVVAAADINGDKAIDVADVVGMVNIILGRNAARSVEKNEAAAMENDVLALDGGFGNRFALSLENQGRYVAAQFDVELSDGLEMESVTLNKERFGEHRVAYAQIGERLYRVMVYSMDGTAIEGERGEILAMQLSGNGAFRIKDIAFVTSVLGVKRFADLQNGTTGIQNLETGRPVDVYGIDGRLIRRQATDLKGLKKGVYVVDGQKVVMK